MQGLKRSSFSPCFYSHTARITITTTTSRVRGLASLRALKDLSAFRVGVYAAWLHTGFREDLTPEISFRE